MKYDNMLQCFKSMFHTILTQEWMNDAHVYEMQVQIWKPNIWGVTALEPVSHKESEEKDCPSPMQEANPLTTSKQSRLIFLVHSAGSKATHLSSEIFKCELEKYQSADRVC